MKGAHSVDGFAEDNSLGRTKVYEEIAAGRLKTFLVGRRRLISGEAAAAWRRLMEAETQESVDG